MIVDPVFSKSGKNQTEDKRCKSAAIVHKKPKLQTCLKDSKMWTCFGTMYVKKPAKSFDSTLNIRQLLLN